MHPVIRVLCLLVLAACLARAGWRELALAAVPLALIYGRGGRGLWSRWLATVRRLRVLLLSIAIVYVWFTPGESLWPALGALSPSAAGLEQGAQRTAALLLLVAAVQLLLTTTGRDQLLAAIRWLVRPLRPFGLDPERLALRVVLAMEAVPQLRAAVAERRQVSAGLPRLRRIGAFADDVFAATLAAAERAPLPAVTVPALAAPAPWQWLLPLALALALGWG